MFALYYLLMALLLSASTTVLLLGANPPVQVPRKVLVPIVVTTSGIAGLLWPIAIPFSLGMTIYKALRK